MQDKTKAPLSRGFFYSFQAIRLTSSNDDGASSGDANDDVGDASPNTCDASGGGANPSACDASPNVCGPSRDDGRGPSELLRA